VVFTVDWGFLGFLHYAAPGLIHLDSGPYQYVTKNTTRNGDDT